MKILVDYITYLFVRIFFCVIQSLSLKQGHAVARGLAWLFTDIFPARRKLLRENLELAYPGLNRAEQREIILKMWEHLVLMAVEISLAGRKVRDLNWPDHIKLTGASSLLSLMHQGRPVIIVTGHFGNFEMGGFSLGVLTYPSHSVARTLDNPFLNKFIKNFRESTGQFLIAKNGGSDDIMDVLSHNGLMAFLADQSAGPKGCMVDFFGKKASTFKAIALLSVQYEAPIVVCYSLRHVNAAGEFEPMQFDMHIAGVLDPKELPPGISNVKDITQWYTKKLEDGIRNQPEQYWWLHRRWKEYEPRKKKKLKKEKNNKKQKRKNARQKKRNV